MWLLDTSHGVGAFVAFGGQLPPHLCGTINFLCAALLLTPVFQRGLGLMGERGCFPAASSAFSFFDSFLVVFFFAMMFSLK